MRHLAIKLDNFARLIADLAIAFTLHYTLKGLLDERH